MDGDNTCEISYHVPSGIGFSFNGNYSETWSMTYEPFFGLSSIKNYVKHLLKKEAKHSVKLNKTMIFNKEDKLNHEANNTCQLCSKTYVIEVRGHCHIEVLHVIFVI